MFRNLSRLSFKRIPVPSSSPFAFSSLKKQLNPIFSNYNLRSFAVQSNVGAPLRKKITTVDVQKMKERGQRISMCTAYTFPSAVHVDLAGIDILLVGDSVSMVELGNDTTLSVTVDQMLYHCKAVVKGANTPLLVGDMPFGSYESCIQDAFKNAVRFLKEGEMDCVKLEGGAERAATVKHLVDGGIAVMGHIGLTPQRISVLGGFRAQGKTLNAARTLIDDAIALQNAGAFAIIIECVPAIVAQAITKAVSIPTIGIGAGPHCSGQVLVYHDLLGFYMHAHHAKVTPMFCKQYAKVGEIIQNALNEYRNEVVEGSFPGNQYSPYKLNENDEQMVINELDSYIKHHPSREDKGTKGIHLSSNPLAASKSKSNPKQQDNDETIKVY